MANGNNVCCKLMPAASSLMQLSEA